MRDAAEKTPQAVSAESAAKEIARLSGLSLKGLRQAWRAEFRYEPPQHLWRNLLLRSLAWRVQEKASGGHDRATIKVLEGSSHQRTGDRRCRRLMPGTTLIREFEGVRHTVTIAPNGFVWRGKSYSSLSAIAKLITGTNWNGPRFFGLREKRAKTADSLKGTPA